MLILVEIVILSALERSFIFFLLYKNIWLDFSVNCFFEAVILRGHNIYFDE